MATPASGNLLIKHLRVSGLLSFGPTGIDLPMRGLNVLIGANGSGKSNLIEVLALLRAAPKNIFASAKEPGSVRDWMWKGSTAREEAVIDLLVTNPGENSDLHHVLNIRGHASRLEIADERIENERETLEKQEPAYYYRYRRGDPILNDYQNQDRPLKREQVLAEESILSQVKDPERYPALTRLQRAYSSIQLFRDWFFGTGAAVRKPVSVDGQSDLLEEGGDNLTLYLANLVLNNRLSQPIQPSLKKLYAEIEDIKFDCPRDEVQLFVKEKGDRQIPANRLSDGTLRYLYLLAILLNPEPPPLVAIEEPELGLHPDVIPHVAELLINAAERMQLVVTTHSKMLIDALAEQPEAVVVCEKRNGESRFERLDEERLRDWLERYSLGELWSIGEIGGNRW